MDRLLRQLYYDPSEATAFSGVRALYEAAKRRNSRITLPRVENWLSKQDVYTLHRPVRRRYQRTRSFGDGYHTHVQADLADMQKLKRHNSGYAYFLTIIDTFSRKMYAVPLKTKRGDEVRDAFRTVFSGNIIPTHLCTDEGREFYNREMQAWCEEHGIRHYSTRSELKAAMCERANRTIKSRLYKHFTANSTWRWVDVIDKIVRGINNSVNRSTGIAPNAVTPKTMLPRVLLQVTKPSRFRVGDTVRISKVKGVFDKAYLPGFQEEIFTVSKVFNRSRPPYYRLKDANDEELEGRFYNEELAKVS